MDDAMVEARARWRGASDRLWPLATADPEGYRRAAELVGALLERLRASVHTVGELAALDPASLFPEDVTRGFGGPENLVGAACAIRAGEIDAADARAERDARIAAARRDGARWVTLSDDPTRTVEMHLASGTTLVATADPYAQPPWALDGEPVGSREEWLAGWARRRAEIDVLDDGGAMVSDGR